MAATQNRRPPVFFWQGLLIMLPVVVLAVASFVSLRQDERTVESEARNRALESMRSLGQAMRLMVDGELQRYLTLQNMWMMGLHSASQASVSLVFPDSGLQADIEKWERDYPGLTFTELVAPQAEILADGRQIDPPGFPTVPQPPKWFRELTPEQRKLWEELRAARNAKEIQMCLQKFVESEPTEDARAAAQELCAPLDQLISHSTALPSETGISFEEIACYRLLSETNARLSGGLLQSIWWQLLEHPSFLSSRLLTLAGSLTNSTEPNLARKFFWLQEFWSSKSKAREWLETLPQPPELENKDGQGPWADWSARADTGALAFFVPCTFKNMGTDANDAPLSGPGYTVWFVPRKVVDAIFDRALNGNQFFIPDYASVAVTVEGKPFESLFYHGIWESKDFVLPYVPGRQGVTDDEILAQLHWEVMGSETLKMQTPMFADAADFEVNLYLANRKEMLSAQWRRAKLFGALIFVAVCTAFIGLLAARRAFRRQLQLNEQKSNFVSSVSHELRAPIASVRLMAENLERGKISEPAKQGEYFRFIVQECRRLSSLIENVLDFSRIEQGRKQYEFEPTNVVALTETTVKLMEPYAAEKGVVLKLETSNIQQPKLGLPTTSSTELNIDGRAIQQALINLIDNAVKHSPKGESVTVGLEVKNATLEMQNEAADTICIFVADRGLGIPAAEQEKIFERFYRLGSELRRETQGVGIGLSVVKHIVEAHGGRVLVESEIGKGSRFTIELQLIQQEETEITEDRP